jgi:iron complex transport system substrate-binding protein
MKKFLSIIILSLLTIILLIGCTDNEVKIKDREGNEVTINKDINRIISSAPSNTEILMELGLSDKIIAVDKYSPTDSLNTDITLIDFRNPDPEAIIALDPDIIIASGHNKVGSEDPFASIKEAGISVVYIPSSNSINGVYEDIRFIANIANMEEKGEKIIEIMQKEIDEVKDIAKNIKNKKKVYFEIAPSPNIFTMGKETFQNDIIELIGGENIFSSETGWISPSGESIIEKNPNVIITNVSYTETPVEDILNREGFSEIDAIKNKQVYLIDANASSRPSPNILKAIKEIAVAVYPDYYEY